MDLGVSCATCVVRGTLQAQGVQIAFDWILARSRELQEDGEVWAGSLCFYGIEEAMNWNLAVGAIVYLTTTLLLL